jgi:hypothetical protein
MLFPFSLRKVLKAGLSRCEEKTLPAFFSLTGFRVVTGPQPASRFVTTPHYVWKWSRSSVSGETNFGYRKREECREGKKFKR